MIMDLQDCAGPVGVNTSPDAWTVGKLSLHL